MTRQGTVIRHTLLDSDTYAAMPDNVRSVFACLLLAADDWGRLPDNPLKLNRMIAVCSKLPEEIARCVNWMLDDGCLSRYQVGQESYLRFTNWEKHQERLKSRDKAIYPSPDGGLESSTNPLIRSKRSPHDVPDGIPGDAPHDVPDGLTKERKGKERRIWKGKERKGNTDSANPERNSECRALVLELFPHFKDYPADLARNVKALDALIRIDHAHIASHMTAEAWKREVFAVLRWARGDDQPRGSFPGWSKVFRSIPRLRQNACEKFLHMQSSFHAAVEFETPPPPVSDGEKNLFFKRAMEAKT
jgi:hypothetical protein